MDLNFMEVEETGEAMDVEPGTVESPFFKY
jgi:hypothetical protein